MSSFGIRHPGGDIPRDVHVCRTTVHRDPHEPGLWHVGAAMDCDGQLYPLTGTLVHQGVCPNNGDELGRAFAQAATTAAVSIDPPGMKWTTEVWVSCTWGWEPPTPLPEVADGVGLGAALVLLAAFAWLRSRRAADREVEHGRRDEPGRAANDRFRGDARARGTTALPRERGRDRWAARGGSGRSIPTSPPGSATASLSATVYLYRLGRAGGGN